MSSFMVWRWFVSELKSHRYGVAWNFWELQCWWACTYGNYCFIGQDQNSRTQCIEIKAVKLGLILYPHWLEEEGGVIYTLSACPAGVNENANSRKAYVYQLVRVNIDIRGICGFVKCTKRITEWKVLLNALCGNPIELSHFYLIPNPFRCRTTWIF